MPEKTCRKCQVSKPISDFYRDVSRKDGLRNWCKICCANYQTNLRVTHPDIVNETDRKSKRKRRNHINEYMRDYMKERRAEIKNELIRNTGGHCIICGYNKCLSALDFHHKDPIAKSFELAKGIGRKKIEEVRKEAEKCVLLCCRCHKEVHEGLTLIPN
jgi:hypothetical protein